MILRVTISQYIKSTWKNQLVIYLKINLFLSPQDCWNDTLGYMNMEISGWKWTTIHTRPIPSGFEPGTSNYVTRNPAAGKPWVFGNDLLSISSGWWISLPQLVLCGRMLLVQSNKLQWDGRDHHSNTSPGCLIDLNFPQTYTGELIIPYIVVMLSQSVDPKKLVFNDS